MNDVSILYIYGRSTKTDVLSQRKWHSARNKADRVTYLFQQLDLALREGCLSPTAQRIHLVACQITGTVSRCCEKPLRQLSVYMLSTINTWGKKKTTMWLGGYVTSTHKCILEQPEELNCILCSCHGYTCRQTDRQVGTDRPHRDRRTLSQVVL